MYVRIHFRACVKIDIVKSGPRPHAKLAANLDAFVDGSGC